MLLAPVSFLTLCLSFRLALSIDCSEFCFESNCSVSNIKIGDRCCPACFDDQPRTEKILQDKLLPRELENRDLVRRTLTTKEVDGKIRELHREMEITKTEAGSHPFFRPKEITNKLSRAKYSRALMSQLALDLANKNQHLARKTRREEEINKEVMQLEAIGRVKDATRLEQALNEWGTVFDHFLEAMELYYGARKGRKKIARTRKGGKSNPMGGKGRPRSGSREQAHRIFGHP